MPPFWRSRAAIYAKMIFFISVQQSLTTSFRCNGFRSAYLVFNMKKKIIPVFLALFSLSAAAAEPAYTCDTARGCTELQGPVFDLGRGATIRLPEGWRFYSYPTLPIPEMAGLREIRAVKNGMVIAITPLPKLEDKTVSQTQLCESMAESGKQYVAKSLEKTVTPVPFSAGKVNGCYVAFTSANPGEKVFSVLKNRRHASVASFAIDHPKAIFSVSAVSETAPDDDYRAALDAIQHIQ